MENENIVREALGRIAYVGDLYDARSDNFCGLSILKKKAPDSAIKITDNHFSDIQFIHSDTYSEKFEKLDIKAELKVSVLAGLFSLEGHGAYLNDQKKSYRAVRSSLLYNIKTKVEQLNVFDDDIKECFALDALNVEKATHIVVGVNWGANCLVTMECMNMDNKEKKSIEGGLKAEFNRLAFKISGKAEVNFDESENKHEESITYRVYADVLPNDEELPQTFQEVLALMKKMPKFVQNSNDGKGKPLQYTLIPISLLGKYLHISAIADRVVKPIDEEAILRFLQLFEEISSVKQQINDIYNDINNHKFCVTNDDIKIISQTKAEFNSREASLRSELAKTLIDIRSGKVDAGESLELIRVKFEKGDYSIENVKIILNGFMDIMEKIAFVDLLIKEGVAYIGVGSSLEAEQMKNPTGVIYILFFGQKLPKKNSNIWSSNRHTFLSLIRSSMKGQGIQQTINNENIKTTFIVVDLDLRPDIVDKEGVKDEIHIARFSNGKYVCSDVLAETIKKKSLCLIRSRDEMEVIISKPNKRVCLEIQCPGSLNSDCKNDEYFWSCFKCNELIEYGFDDYFYCSCGRSSAKSYEYRCKSEKHGLDYKQFHEKALSRLLNKLRPFKEMNILVLGETGVGKSTWINGMVNYMTYATLEEAEENESLSLIASHFTIFDENFEERIISTGEDKNEVHAAGQSATQDPKSYVFEWGDTKVRIIDTPGIGDTRGIEQDKKNFEAILRFIGNLEELHGICILLKPNNARLTVMFNFCIKELLTHLHRSAAKNIVFCFTNARSTFYKPGDTFPALKKLLSEQKDVTIDLCKHTVYCMDNESFRFLCAIHNGVPFNENDRNNFAESWVKSVMENNRMFEHISKLEPHVIKDTISLNEARKVIVNLTVPMAQISKNIQDNIAVAKDKKDEIESTKLNEKDLSSRLHIPSIKVVNRPLDYHRTVCTHSNCVRHFNVNGTTQNEFITHCHEDCGLTYCNTHPNPDLKNCAAMNGNNYCENCGHFWDMHMHIMYEQIYVEEMVIDPDIETQIKQKRNLQDVIRQAVKNAEDRVKQLEDEQNVITKVSVKFGYFLKTNAITPYNDALSEYLEILIRQEQDKVSVGGDRKTLDGLMETQSAYKHEVKAIKESMDKGENSTVLGPNDIKKLVSELYKLPLKGTELKNCMEIESNSYSRMTYSEVHYRPKYRNNNQKNGQNYQSENFKNQKKTGFISWASSKLGLD